MIPGKTLSASLTAQPVYIEDVFSTYLYTGTNAALTITNGIDLAGEGGLVWGKARNIAGSHYLVDTARGAAYGIRTNTTGAQTTSSSTEDVTSFNADGFSLGTGYNSSINNSGEPTVAWTFRKQEKFFDIVAYTGNGVAGRTISHNLNSTPGCVMIKNVGASGDWIVWHRALTFGYRIRLNSGAGDTNLSAEDYFGNGSIAVDPTSTVFTVGNNSAVNKNNDTYVAYLFAHDSGGFGVSGTDNVISCGSFTTNASGVATITLGYEPQWVLLKNTTAAEDWYLYDSMRGIPTGSNDALLIPNSATSESTTLNNINLTSTGFGVTGLAASSNYVYITVRRGPMKTPTTGTSVFYPYAAAFPGNAVVTTGFPVDLQFQKDAGSVSDIRAVDRLRGVSSTPTSPSAAFPFLVTNTTDAESTGTGTTLNWNNTGFTVGNTYSTDPKHWAASFRRAPKFFDVVCYTGTGAVQTISHNLGIAPSIMIIKRRSSTAAWTIYPDSNTRYLNFDTSSAPTSSGVWNDTSPTASVFTVGTAGLTNAIGQTYVAYLFGNCPGVSSAGTYTGTGTTQQINCGFASGARFVLIKCRNNTGPWYVWDSARGIVAGNDPYLLLNSSAAEVTNTDYIDTYSQGFEISSTAPANINGNGSIFIYIAIA